MKQMEKLMSTAIKVSHTPGPWAIHPMRSSITGLDAGRGFAYPWHIVQELHVSRPIGGSIDKEYDRATYARQICAINDYCRYESAEEVEANARLIAAAPDLLEALERIVDWVCQPDAPRTLEEDRAFLINTATPIAKACIKKAKPAGVTVRE